MAGGGNLRFEGKVEHLYALMGTTPAVGQKSGFCGI